MLNKKELFLYDSSFSILQNIVLVEKDYADCEKFNRSSLSTEQALSKLGLKIQPESVV